MGALIEVTLPVFLVIGFGSLAVWGKFLSDDGINALMTFAQQFAIPCMLFSAISQLDLGQNFDWPFLGSYYTGSLAAFLIGMFGARLLFSRPWPDSVAIGFCAMFANSVLLGLAITESAYGVGALGPNYAIIALHAPFCYVVGITAMETVRAGGASFVWTLRTVVRTSLRNALMLGILLGFIANITGLWIPGPVMEAIGLMQRAALPVALFALGGVLYRYRPEGDLKEVAFVCLISLVIHPAIVTLMSDGVVGLTQGQRQSAILTAAMAPGINAFLFANMYGVARRVAATSVLIGTALSILTVTAWLQVIG